MSEEITTNVKKLQSPTTLNYFIEEGNHKILSVFKGGNRACLAVINDCITEPEFEKFINLLCDEFWLQNQSSKPDESPTPKGN